MTQVAASVRWLSSRGSLPSKRGGSQYFAARNRQAILRKRHCSCSNKQLSKQSLAASSIGLHRCILRQNAAHSGL